LLPLGASEGHQGTPGPTRNRALAHQGENDLLADGRAIISNRRNVSSTRVGLKAGTKLAMTEKGTPAFRFHPDAATMELRSCAGKDSRGAKILFITFVDAMFTTLFERLFTKVFDLIRQTSAIACVYLPRITD
jgi:hypothetical protein